MREFALFVGWGGTHPGRETVALKHEAEWKEILTRAKAVGEIEDFETVSSARTGRAGRLHPRLWHAGEAVRSPSSS